SCGAIIGTAMILISIYAMEAYGAVLFILTPLFAATVSAVIYRLRQPDEYGWTFTVSFLSLILPACLLLLLGLEELICIAIAALPAAVFGYLGTLLGQEVAAKFKIKSSHMAMTVFLLPSTSRGGIESCEVGTGQSARIAIIGSRLAARQAG